MSPLELTIDRTWDDRPTGSATRLTLHPAADGLVLHIDAPWHGDPPPASAPGPTAGLWEHEVVEVMFLGSDDRYLELEFGPHGHHLGLSLHGCRNVVRQAWDIPYEVRRKGERWAGRAQIAASWLPYGWDRINAFAIHGVGADRTYLAWRPAGGDAPDFHILDAFAPLSAAQPGS